MTSMCRFATFSIAAHKATGSCSTLPACSYPSFRPLSRRCHAGRAGALAVAKHDGGRRPIRLPDSRRSICER
jgi:hypothetical protein